MIKLNYSKFITKFTARVTAKVKAKITAKIYRRFLSLAYSVTVIAVFGLVTIAHAGSRGFEELKADYLLLRNRDPKISDPAHWRSLANRLQQAAKNRLKSREGDQALFMAATLLTELAKSGHSPTRGSDGQKARDILRDVSGRGGEYADDALYRAVELYRSFGDENSVSAIIGELRKRFPESEFAPVVQLERVGRRHGNSGSSQADTRSAAEAVEAIDVVLDPGHGGDDLGAQGYAGLLEKDVTLSVALATKKILEAHGLSVALTRQADVFLPLSSRTRIANQRKGTVFVSIHANASISGVNRGIETYVLDGEQSENTKLLVQRENGSEASDLAFLLSDVIQREKRPEAQRLATEVHPLIVSRLRQAGFNASDLGVKKGPFFVLVGSHMPGILVEIGFIDHPVEGKDMGGEKYRTAVAKALADGIIDFLKSESNRRRVGKLDE